MPSLKFKPKKKILKKMQIFVRFLLENHRRPSTQLLTRFSPACSSFLTRL